MSTSDPTPERDADDNSQRRFNFARRWERKKQARSLKRAWMVLLMDVALLALIVALALIAVGKIS